MPNMACADTAVKALAIPVPIPFENTYMIFSTKAKPRDTKTAYTMPSNCSLKFGFFHTKIYTASSLKASSQRAATKKALPNTFAILLKIICGSKDETACSAIIIGMVMMIPAKITFARSEIGSFSYLSR